MILKNSLFYPNVKYLHNFDKEIILGKKLCLQVDGFNFKEVYDLLKLKIETSLFRCDFKFGETRFLITSNINYVKTSDRNYNMLLNEDSYYIGLDYNFLIVYSKSISGVVSSFTTLNNILKFKKINKFEIIDYPSIKKRGIVEAFYGYPYNFKDRINLIKDLSNYKLNYYIYAPKNDLYHRSLWNDLYPKRYIKNFRKIADISNKYHFNFVWAIHPGDSINLDSDDDFSKAILKFKQLYDAGIRFFGIFFDDIKKNIDAKKQSDFINKVDNTFIKKNNLPPLVVVLTRYCISWGPDINTYFKVMLDRLNPSINVMWTGENTISYVDDKYFDFKKLFNKNKRSSIWFNYPVNDYCNNKMLISKIPYLSNNLSCVDGFYINPMKYLNMSKISMYNLASYMWNIKNYDYNKSWDIACKMVFKSDYKYFINLLDNISYLNTKITDDKFFFLDESKLIKSDISKLKDLIKSNSSLSNIIETLEDKFLTYLIDINNIKRVKNKKILSELRPFMKSFYYICNSFLYLLKYLKTKNNKYKKKSLSLIKRMNKCYIYDLKEDENQIAKKTKFIVEVGEMILKPTIIEILNLKN